MEDDDLVTSQLGAADYLEEPLRECRHGQKYTEHDSVAEQEDALVSKTSVH